MRRYWFGCGYSLLEVLVSLAILAGLLGMGLPSFARWLAASRLRSAAAALADGLRLTRLEAVQRNGRVVMCKSTDGVQCTLQGAWQQGWIVFGDANQSGAVDPGETIVYREAPMPGGPSMVGNAHVRDYVSYTGLGRAEMRSGAFQAGTIRVCFLSSGIAEAYEVVVNSMGRPRVGRTVFKSCTEASD